MGLPNCFSSEGQGGGVIQGSASEGTLVALLAARARALEHMRRHSSPETSDHALLSRMTLYASDQVRRVFFFLLASYVPSFFLFRLSRFLLCFSMVYTDERYIISTRCAPGKLVPLHTHTHTPLVAAPPRHFVRESRELFYLTLKYMSRQLQLFAAKRL